MFRLPVPSPTGFLLLGGLIIMPTAILAADPPKTATQETATKGPAVSTIEARRGTIRDTVTVGGTLVAREEILVAAQVDGLAIVEILVDEGTRVRNGDVLARLSRESTDISIAQNKAQLARSDAAIAQAKAQIVDAEAAKVAAINSFARAKNLREGGITTAETYDQRQSLAQQTTARVTSAQQALKLSEADKAVAEAQSAEYALRLVRTDIKAPADGVISRRTARTGAIAAGASDPLFRIIENGTIELEADIAEAALARLTVNQAAKIRPAGHAVDVDATVRLISPEVSRTTRLGKVRLTLTNSQDLAIGAFARGVIEVAKSDGIVLPLSAVQFGVDGARVQVVINGAVATRPVTVGLRSSAMVEIVKGLEVGEQVISIAGTFLRNGDRITPVPQQLVSN
jgi:HlyD family secretion protein